ncbi:MAG: hemolysin family protein [candidate division KSB1 bacterium]|jgi:gliding motility-associated protein GldE|nr:hemolysin family protein [candidate division KSB1 bacterium]
MLSAFFSSSETAFFSLSNENRNRLRDKRNKNADRVLSLLVNPKDLLITLITGNMIVNMAATVVAIILAIELSRNVKGSVTFIIAISILVVSVVILILGELVPKLIAIKNSEKIAVSFSFPVMIFSYLLYPITKMLNQFPIMISKMMVSRVDRHLLSIEELQTSIEMDEEKGALIEEEKEMIHSIIEFAQTSAKEVMIPRTDMVCVDKRISIDELVDIIRDKGHTRIPVYDNGVDNIMGTLHAKELLTALNVKGEDITLETLIRPALFVPESKMLDELLRDFKREKTHMAIVVDEYGGTAGLVTLEDVIEEIVGEIHDEYDIEKRLYQILEDGSYMVDAKIDLDELNTELNLSLPTDAGYESLGGLILNITGSFPSQRDEIEYEGYMFIVEKIQKNRIIQVRIVKPVI